MDFYPKTDCRMPPISLKHHFPSSMLQEVALGGLHASKFCMPHSLLASSISIPSQPPPLPFLNEKWLKGVVDLFQMPSII